MQILTFPSLSLTTPALPKAPPHRRRSKWSTICTTVLFICVLKCVCERRCVCEKHSVTNNEREGQREKEMLWMKKMLLMYAGLFDMMMPGLCASLWGLIFLPHIQNPTAIKSWIIATKCQSVCLDLSVHKEFSDVHAYLQNSLYFHAVCPEAFCQTSELHLLMCCSQALDWPLLPHCGYRLPKEVCGYPTCSTSWKNCF